MWFCKRSHDKRRQIRCNVRPRYDSPSSAFNIKARVSASSVAFKLSGNRVIFGATVLLVDEHTDKEKTYTIVGEEEADISKGFISYTSPVGRALIGKCAGDTVEVSAPSGVRSYEVLNVAFKPQ